MNLLSLANRTASSLGVGIRKVTIFLLVTASLVTAFMPMESLSVIILSFAAEFTAGFAAAGALLEAGVLTIKQTVMALLIGNILAFPVRARRHQLPRYIGIYDRNRRRRGHQTLAVFFGKALKMAQGVPHTHAAKPRLTLDKLSGWAWGITKDSDSKLVLTHNLTP